MSVRVAMNRTPNEAREAARRWVSEEAADLPGFDGAFFTGSINRLADEVPFPESSDVDVIVVFTDTEPPRSPGKFVYRGVLLEASHIRIEWFPTPESALGNYHMAHAMNEPGIIADPSGRLSEVHKVVSENFAKRRWVRGRVENARGNALRFLDSVDDSEDFHDRVTGWLFGTSVTTHMLLVAGLENPTVRKRYAAASELLERYGRPDFREALLELLGCRYMRRKRVSYHLDALTGAFDAAKKVIRTPFFFASDISDVARPIAIGGSREMIEAGLHREAVFWIAATYARCRKILHHDAPPEMKMGFDTGFRTLLEDLGISSNDDLRRRVEWARAFLPRVYEVAEEIMAADPDIEE